MTANLAVSTVWQVSQRAPTWPRCTSVWHETQVSDTFVNPTRTTGAAVVLRTGRDDLAAAVRVAEAVALYVFV